MIKIRLYIQTPYVGGLIEEIWDLESFGVSDEEWESISETEKNNYLDEWAQEFLVNHVDYGANIIEG